jgi:hypothetical protein
MRWNRTVVASWFVLFGCGNSAKDPDKLTAGSGSAIAVTGSAVVATGSAIAATADATIPSDAAVVHDPATLELRAGEKRHEPLVETVWNIPGGAVTATVVDFTASGSAAQPITKLVVWGNGKRHDIVKTVALCDAQAELRHVADSRIVFHCAIAPVGDEPEARIEDWLIRWSEETNAPLRNRKWRGDPADTEPRWASPPTSSKSSTHATHHKKHTDEKCCCEANMEGNTTHGWEHPSDCVDDMDNELAAVCVTKDKCKDIEPE